MIGRLRLNRGVDHSHAQGHVAVAVADDVNDHVYVYRQRHVPPSSQKRLVAPLVHSVISAFGSLVSHLTIERRPRAALAAEKVPLDSAHGSRPSLSKHT